jgi:hypothetical protein
MDLRRRSFRLVALAVVVSLPLLGMSGVAAAKAKAGCHKTHSCKGATGSGGPGGTGGTSPGPITVQVDPNPLVETGQSYVAATIQVETSPSFAGDAVNIDSSQLEAACSDVYYRTLQETEGGENDIQVVLDDDGNVTVVVVGYNCAPGSSVVEADLTVAPFYTALTTLDAEAPIVTATGVSGYPTTSGTVTTGEVETGDTSASGDSDVYAVFYVETNPVYAEQYAEISSAQLEDRCITGGQWYAITPTGVEDSATGSEAQIDDDGNVVFLFIGSSCAAGPSEVIADVLAGSHPTYTTTFNINPPQPTI